jgi:hypothetical protein
MGLAIALGCACGSTNDNGGPWGDGGGEGQAGSSSGGATGSTGGSTSSGGSSTTSSSGSSSGQVGGGGMDAGSGGSGSGRDAGSGIVDASSSGSSGCAAGGGGGAGWSNADGGTPADSLVSVTPAGTSVELYHPLYVEVVTTQSFRNGYDPDEIQVDAHLTGPCGEIDQPCFFKSSANSQATWECRFAPRSLGTYSYTIALNEGGAVATSAPFMLTSTPTTTSGFLHADVANATSPNVSSLYNFRFDSGQLWRGVGEDVAWEIGQYTYPTVIPRLHADGLNMFRIWHCPWNLPIEWNSAPNVYSTDSSTYFDQIVTLAEQNGVYMMIMLNDFREFSEQWSSSPYNTSNGGWCNSPGQFFTDPNAIANYKKKLRYYIARWGYSPSIQSFEFFNEIDNAMGSTDIAADAVASWTDTMASYLHGIDPYNHLVTSSVSWQSLNFWSAKGIDFTQSHLYGPDNRITRLPSQSQGYISTYQKPYVCGEFSRRWESATSEPSGNYRQELHYGMWLGMFQSIPILPMTWWWDSHWDWGDDFVFQSMAGFSNDLVAKAGAGTVTALNTSASGGLENGGLSTGKVGYVWVSNYNPGTGQASGVTLTVSGLRSGNNPYTVEAYDTWNGGFATPQNTTSQNGTLTINVGTLNTTSTGSDAAYRIVDVNGP